MEEEIFTKEEYETLKEVVSKLENVDKSNGDLFDLLAIVTSDVVDIMKALETEDFQLVEKEKKDAVNSTLDLISKICNF